MRPFCFFDHSKTEQNGRQISVFRMVAQVQTVLYKNKIIFFFIKRPRLLLKFGFRMVGSQLWFRTFENRTIRKKTFKTFGFRMDLEFERSEFEPQLQKGNNFVRTLQEKMAGGVAFISLLYSPDHTSSVCERSKSMTGPLWPFSTTSPDSEA